MHPLADRVPATSLSTRNSRASMVRGERSRLLPSISRPFACRSSSGIVSAYGMRVRGGLFAIGALSHRGRGRWDAQRGALFRHEVAHVPAGEWAILELNQ